MFDSIARAASGIRRLGSEQAPPEGQRQQAPWPPTVLSGVFLVYVRLAVSSRPRLTYLCNFDVSPTPRRLCLYRYKYLTLTYLEIPPVRAS